MLKFVGHQLVESFRDSFTAIHPKDRTTCYSPANVFSGSDW